MRRAVVRLAILSSSAMSVDPTQAGKAARQQSAVAEAGGGKPQAVPRATALCVRTTSRPGSQHAGKGSNGSHRGLPSLQRAGSPTCWIGARTLLEMSRPPERPCVSTCQRCFESRIGLPAPLSGAVFAYWAGHVCQSRHEAQSVFTRCSLERIYRSASTLQPVGQFVGAHVTDDGHHVHDPSNFKQRGLSSHPTRSTCSC